MITPTPAEGRQPPQPRPVIQNARITPVLLQAVLRDSAYGAESPNHRYQVIRHKAESPESVRANDLEQHTRDSGNKIYEEDRLSPAKAVRDSTATITVQAKLRSGLAECKCLNLRVTLSPRRPGILRAGRWRIGDYQTLGDIVGYADQHE